MTHKLLQSRNSAKVTSKDIIMPGIWDWGGRNSRWVPKVDSQAHEVRGHCQPHAQHLWRYPRSSLQTRPYEGGEDTSKLFTNVLQSHFWSVYIVLYGLLCLSWEASICATSKRSKEAHLVIVVQRLYTGQSHRYEGDEEAGHLWKYAALDNTSDQWELIPESQLNMCLSVCL